MVKMKLEDLKQYIETEFTLNFLAGEIWEYIVENYQSKLKFGNPTLVKWGINDDPEWEINRLIWKDEGNNFCLIYANYWRSAEEITMNENEVYINIPVEHICNDTWKEFIDKKFSI